MPKEYIERYKAMQICEMHSQNCFNSCNSKGQDVADLILDDIVTIPTADVVEVVRCKDCQHWFKLKCYVKNRTEKGNKNIHSCYADDFCSYGERMDKE